MFVANMKSDRLHFYGVFVLSDKSGIVDGYLVGCNPCFSSETCLQAIRNNYCNLRSVCDFGITDYDSASRIFNGIKHGVIHEKTCCS